MKVLVTGASGFLGKHVVKALVDRGDTVVGIDNREGDIYPAHLIIANITDPSLHEYVDGAFDCIIHLAAIAAPKECEGLPGVAFDVNVAGTHNVLKLAVAHGVKQFVFASSAHVYGISPRYLPTDEVAPLLLLDTYTVTKQIGERLCELFYETHGLPYVSLRLYNGYGPGQQPGYFIPDMFEQAKGGKITLRGGRTTKDFLYVDDMVRAIVASTTTPYVGPLNIGSCQESSLVSVAARIAELTGVKLLTHAVSPPTEEATRMCCDYRRAREVLGWRPVVDLQAGLARTFEWGRP